jgi:membrane-associated protease RseP (regulator of RpoE activity)
MYLYIIVVIISIVLHELGHLLASLYFKIKVNAFSVGFGKILLHKTWKGIDWRISLIPLGGYCDIEEKIGKPNSLAEISYWKQMIVILSGVGMNIFITIICYLINFKSISKGLEVDWLAFNAILSSDYSYLTQYLAKSKVYFILIQASLLNLSLAITNLIPLPALDGGYIWLLPLQKHLSEKLYKYIIYFGFVFIMLIQVIFVYWWYIK